MTQTFSTNRGTIVFYVFLSVIVVPFGVINLYRVVTDAGTYSIGFKSFIAPVLPLLTYFSYRTGLLSVMDGGVKIGGNVYSYDGHDFSFGQQELALKDRPLTSLWKATYDILTITPRASSEVTTVPLEMSKGRLAQLKSAITTVAVGQPRP